MSCLLGEENRVCGDGMEMVLYPSFSFVLWNDLVFLIALMTFPTFLSVGELHLGCIHSYSFAVFISNQHGTEFLIIIIIIVVIFFCGFFSLPFGLEFGGIRYTRISSSVLGIIIIVDELGE